MRGLSSFALYVGDANSFTSGISNSRSANFDNYIFLRILSKEYRVILPSKERSSSSLSSLRHFEEAIKVSFFCSLTISSNFDEVKYKSNNNKNNGNNSHDNNDDIGNGRSKNDNDNNINENMRENEKISGKKVVKRKLKSYARLPLQFHEFENVRNTGSHVHSCCFCLSHTLDSF